MTNRLQLLLLKYDDEVRHLLDRPSETDGKPLLLKIGSRDQTAPGTSLGFVVLGMAIPGSAGAVDDLALTPKALLTALAREVDAALAQADGPDDRVLVPTSLDRLLDRVAEAPASATGERGMPMTGDRRPLAFAGWKIDPASRQLHGPTGAKVALTAAEFALLMVFARYPRQVLSRRQLHELAFGRSGESLDRGIDILVSRLRRRLAAAWPKRPAAPRDLIKTVRGSGYLFDADVQAMAI